MTILVGLLNLALGSVYTGYGVITAVEMKRGWRSYGFSHFGLAWILMAFTCGPHHLTHGIHTLFEGRQGGPLDLVAVVAGLPAGAAFILLRLEAFRGGAGDRFIGGTPRWILALPTAAAIYVTALIAAGMNTAASGFQAQWIALPNLGLFVIYMTIGYFLLRTQLQAHGGSGGWSTSGLSLAFVFPTCALMHAVFILYAGVGLYALDPHGFVIDWAGVPAGLYFLWVVRRLYHEALRDWNDAPAPAAA
ncbi:MAG: hypothetical protein ACRDJ4_02855 [Actinomycetota bacterium]